MSTQVVKRRHSSSAYAEKAADSCVHMHEPAAMHAKDYEFVIRAATISSLMHLHFQLAPYWSTLGGINEIVTPPEC